MKNWKLYKTFAWFNYIGRVLTIKYLIFFEGKAKGLRGMTVEEKYTFMRDRESNILLRIPSKYLAAHLGITEESLSKIRAAR